MQTATDRTRRRVEAVLARNGTPTRKNRKNVTAYLNHGRWVADCPCNGAELAAPGMDMVCGSCGTISSVDFPDIAADIEKVLGLREPYHQNWHPGETVEELTAQNIEHGIWEDL